MTTDFRILPPGLPVPEDDGAADHLPGALVPQVVLPSTHGPIDLAEAARHLLVAYIYPRTGTPGCPSPDGWNAIPGARGCTPQSCAFRDRVDDFARHGASLLALSAQPASEQEEFAAREHIPYPILSDRGLRLASALRLPTFDVAGMTLYKRLTFVADEGRIERVFYPVFPPDRNAADVLTWLNGRARQAR
jgi:peroxiredoxin